MTPKSLLILLAFICMCLPCLSQDNPAVIDKITNFPSNFFNRINQQSANLEDKLDRQTEKYLQRLLKTEKKLKKQLQETDSLAASDLADAGQYEQIRKLFRQHASASGETSAQYIPYLD